MRLVIVVTVDVPEDEKDADLYWDLDTFEKMVAWAADEYMSLAAFLLDHRPVSVTIRQHDEATKATTQTLELPEWAKRA